MLKFWRCHTNNVFVDMLDKYFMPQILIRSWPYFPIRRCIPAFSFHFSWELEQKSCGKLFWEDGTVSLVTCVSAPNRTVILLSWLCQQRNNQSGTAESLNKIGSRLVILETLDCPDDGGSTQLWIVGLLRDYTELYPRRVLCS